MMKPLIHKWALYLANATHTGSDMVVIGDRVVDKAGRTGTITGGCIHVWLDKQRKKSQGANNHSWSYPMEEIRQHHSSDSLENTNYGA